MFKKLISGITALALAVTILPSVAFAGNSYVSDMTLSNYSFNPTNGESTTVHFAVYEDSLVNLFAVSQDTDEEYPITNSYERQYTGRVSYDWDGKDGRTLPNGDYKINLSVYVNGSEVSRQSQMVTLYGATSGSSGSGSSGIAPSVFSLNASPYSIDPEQNESTVLSFYVAEDALVDAYIKDSSGSVVRDFSQYDTTATTNSSNGTYRSVTWYGGNDGGYPLEDGTYFFYVDAQNDYGQSFNNWISVEIKRETVQEKIQIKNSYVSPSTFNSYNGESAGLYFTLVGDGYINAFVEDSSGNFIKGFSGYSGTTWHDNATNGSDYHLTWNGYDTYGNRVSDGTYYFYLSLSNGVYDTYVTKAVTVNTYESKNTPSISNLSVSPSNFDPEGNETAKASFRVQDNAYITAYVKKGSTIYKTFNNYDNDFYYGTTGSRYISWNGRDDYGNIVEDGVYRFYVYTYYDGKSDTEYVNVTVDTDNDPYYNSNIKSMKLYPSSTWDPTEENLDIDYTLRNKVYDLDITASKSGYKTIKLYSDPNYAPTGSYSFKWNGRNQYGDFVEPGIWKITINAGGDKVTKNINVKYDGDDTNIEAYVTKKEFDPEKGEVTTLLFKVDEDAEVDVEILNSNTVERVLWNNIDVDRNEWYAVEWDGKKSNGKYASYNNNWRFKITIDGHYYDLDTKYVNASVKHDTALSKAANITKDYTMPVVFDDKLSGSVDISFCIDDAADISLNIYKSVASSGKNASTIIDDDKFKAGCHTIKWDVEDDYGNDLNDGVYSYKFVSETTYNNKDTETGVFVIGNAGNIVKKKKKVSGDECGGYWDLGNLSETGEMCKAIEWAQNEGIFAGYSDGSFRLNDTINRAEVLKVVLEAFNAKLISSGGSKLGFSDVNPNAWYMTYAATAKANGLLEGYAGSNKAGMTDDINRAEILKFVFEASDAFAGYKLDAGYAYAYVYSDVTPSKWYYEYAVESYKYNLFESVVVGGKKYLKPAQLVKRGEVALLLFRMQKAGLL